MSDPTISMEQAQRRIFSAVEKLAAARWATNHAIYADLKEADHALTLATATLDTIGSDLDRLCRELGGLRTGMFDDDDGMAASEDSSAT